MAIKAANREPCTPPRSTLILTPAFVVYTELGIDPLIALGAFELIQAIKDISDGGDIWSIPVRLAAALVPGAFVLKLKEKKTLSTVFAVLSIAYTVFIVIVAFVNGLRFYFYYQWFDIISYIFYMCFWCFLLCCRKLQSSHSLHFFL